MVQTRMSPNLRHIHPILEACAVHGSASAAEKLIKQMTTRQSPSPDGHCMECLAKVRCTSWQLAIIYQLRPHCLASHTVSQLMFDLLQLCDCDFHHT